ncbi:hypothetical protein C8F01DRAFT_1259115 [Mycena amicta]|nr:hypothetical protein C8F01DRAFT_1259115 [Mycena amicta]
MPVDHELDHPVTLDVDIPPRVASFAESPSDHDDARRDTVLCRLLVTSPAPTRNLRRRPTRSSSLPSIASQSPALPRMRPPSPSPLFTPTLGLPLQPTIPCRPPRTR